ncbi:Oidioi.mRNA.OKI2018_I69.XSR.g16696.t1.cds [Oikopleura dioica]|uniref:Oidioi.mRNA.OKI2018_I69.XSR.g16696.t1.cds n=1 Tax=Oikopleura dioica TaxID=34765 RepID=A0ABN7SNA6_OIKDI|nr:Oidioi.mRNA.OKI2018_I69.XSR.g16696.t1.cds [Oikopleura dioica]
MSSQHRRSLPFIRSFFRSRTGATVYEPTYKLLPDEKPNLEVIRFVLTSVLKNVPTVIDTSFVTKITSEIHDRVKLMMPKRYRFIIQDLRFKKPSIINTAISI